MVVVVTGGPCRGKQMLTAKEAMAEGMECRQVAAMTMAAW
jgi:hypothetical protein